MTIKTEPLPKSEFTLITPGMATELLEKSEAAGHKNRTISDAKVQQWVHEMKEDWDPAASTIVVDTDGILIDGYHRMYACVMAGVPFTTFIVTTATPERTVTKVDVGRHRSAGDILAMNHWKYGAPLAAASRMKLRHAVKGDAWNNHIVVTNTMIFDYVNSKRRLVTHMIEDIPHNCAKIMSPTKAFFLHFMAKSYDNSQEFINQIVHGYRSDGTGLPQRDPAFVLRERLRAARIAKQTNRHTDKLDARQEAYLVCVAYQKWLKNEKITRLALPKLQMGHKTRTFSEAYKLPKSL